MSGLGGVVLAAGMSSRMGAFKPLLVLDGETILGRVVRMMRGAGAEPVVVVTGHGHELLTREPLGGGVIFVRNPLYARSQMLDSLRLGLRALETRCDRILVSPADIPLVRPETVRALLESDGAFVRPVYCGKAGHPVILSAELIAMVDEYRGEGGLRGAVEHSGVPVSELAVDDEGVLLDCDTPEQYEALRRICRARRAETASQENAGENGGVEQ